MRKVYNLALQARTTAWFTERRRINYVQTSALLPEWKKTEEYAFLAEVSSVPLQQTGSMYSMNGRVTALT